MVLLQLQSDVVGEHRPPALTHLGEDCLQVAVWLPKRLLSSSASTPGIPGTKSSGSGGTRFFHCIGGTDSELGLQKRLGDGSLLKAATAFALVVALLNLQNAGTVVERRERMDKARSLDSPRRSSADMFMQCCTSRHSWRNVTRARLLTSMAEDPEPHSITKVRR